ncbi:MAG: UDP-N-acetylmuramate dehydrogenase [Clostridia bacterium]|nr:UDP-N-acetylmuramate dehydrogenase [Clostridia bacterium]
MERIQSLAGELRQIADLRVEEDHLLAPHTTFRIGGPAALALFPATAEAAASALRAIARAEVPHAVIGRGSNLLCADAGFAGAVLFTGEMRRVQFAGTEITADCGVSLTSLAYEAGQRGLDGLAFAYGIPASIGGALRMNAGAYGGEMADVVYESTYFDLSDGEIHQLDTASHALSYRHSFYADHPECVILSAILHLREGDGEAICAQMQELMQRRRDKQPLEYPSAGSVFKRPVGYFAGKLIEDCGLKGYTIGGAQVSEKHAGFIINRGNATADDVLRLIAHIQSCVLEQFGVELKCEVCRLG